MNKIADVVIVGGGILGVAVAWALAERRFKVVLLEEKSLCAGTTGCTFGWLNATSKTSDRTYHHLNTRGMAVYTELEARWGREALGMCGGGYLAWVDRDDAHAVDGLYDRIRRLQQWDYPAELLELDTMRLLEPQVRFPSTALGLFAPADRWVEAPMLARFFAGRVRALGGEIRENCPANAFRLDAAGRLAAVVTPQGEIATARAVLAGGMHLPTLVRMAARDPIDSERFAVRRIPGLLVQTPPGSAMGLIERLVEPLDGSGLHLRPTLAGGVMLGADGIDEQLDDLPPGEEPQALAAELLHSAARHLKALGDPGLAARSQIGVGVRPVPADGFPIVGPLASAPDVYGAVTHSGITLAPLLGRLLAEEIATGRCPDLLEPYRPARFVGAAVH
ncbi:NAD(P)/FAD-dependent oxidoreductase [Gloeobacter morelensis]|uniref:FAD-binding oxidoreductase n=1 Tax=Gloeobacter morelensis MG652769 TaxID=2781736 RepID=A0ABY3PJ32_9CYAN|nr:FAD-binding oxidoreductase [Gloeobacter morelensis]UFP93662.1 FAD-binding oxidoreductase [Gloeobacter morelensis MG652769]